VLAANRLFLLFSAEYVAGGLLSSRTSCTVSLRQTYYADVEPRWRQPGSMPDLCSGGSTSVAASGHIACDRSVAEIVKCRVGTAGLNPEAFAAHPLRRGGPAHASAAVGP
jgi:hypothetical protein